MIVTIVIPPLLVDLVHSGPAASAHVDLAAPFRVHPLTQIYAGGDGPPVPMTEAACGCHVIWSSVGGMRMPREVCDLLHAANCNQLTAAQTQRADRLVRQYWSLQARLEMMPIAQLN